MRATNCATPRSPGAYEERRMHGHYTMPVLDCQALSAPGRCGCGNAA